MKSEVESEEARCKELEREKLLQAKPVFPQSASVPEPEVQSVSDGGTESKSSQPTIQSGEGADETNESENRPVSDNESENRPVSELKDQTESATSDSAT